MALVSFTFRAFAVDQTDSWVLEKTPLEGVPAFGVYVICEGEATHLCSLDASTRADFLYNAFLYPTEDEAAHEEAGDLMHEDGGEGTTYFGYVDCKRSSDYVSTPLRVTVDTRDLDYSPHDYAASVAAWKDKGNTLQEAHALARRSMARDAAWEEATEALNADCRHIPVTDEPAAYERHRRRKVMAQARSDERYASPTLFASAGVPLPLEMRD